MKKLLLFAVFAKVNMLTFPIDAHRWLANVRVYEFSQQLIVSLVQNAIQVTTTSGVIRMGDVSQNTLTAMDIVTVLIVVMNQPIAQFVSDWASEDIIIGHYSVH